MKGAIITCELPVGGHGKITPGFYFPTFARLLKGHGLAHYRTIGLEQFRAVRPVGEVIVILIHNETKLHASARYLERVRNLERDAIDRFGAQRVIHPTQLGLKIGDKTETNRWLSVKGILMPSFTVDKHAPTKTFSNQRVGSHRPVRLVETGDSIDPSRYNTHFIDTAYEYNGRLYYVSLRAVGVGRRCVAAYARMRPVEEGPSVHAVDTPCDPELLNHFHQEFIAKRMPELTKLSEQIGHNLGLGFYVHDILPETRTGKLYLSEIGYKFDEFSLRNHLRVLRTQITFQESLFDPFVEASTKAFLEEVVKLKLLSL